MFNKIKKIDPFREKYRPNAKINTELTNGAITIITGQLKQTIKKDKIANTTTLFRTAAYPTQERLNTYTIRFMYNTFNILTTANN